MSKLPRFILYAFAQFLFVVILISGYRRRVVNKNLEIAFPDKTKKERRKIKIKFYHIFAEYLVEFIMLFSVNKDKMVGRFIFEENISLLNKIKAENHPCFVLAGHVFNWEWYAILVDYFPQEKMYAIYKPLKNKALDKNIDALRFRLGGTGITMKNTAKFILANKDDANSMYYFLVDQSPKKSAVQHYTQFFNQKTSIFTGYEALANKVSAGVVFVAPERIGFGKYRYHFKELLPKESQWEEGELVSEFYRNLEETIERNPANWLWSHKRWKEELEE